MTLQCLRLTPDERVRQLQRAMFEIEAMHASHKPQDLRNNGLVKLTLQLLTQHQVEFVIVGGIAISLHGSSSYLTYVLDVAYARTRDNFKRLAAALAPYHPRPRDFPADLPFVWDEETIKQGTNFTLTTDLGNIDLLGEVAGLGDYEQVRDQSIVMSLFNLPCQVLSLDALIVAKRAAGRPKDLLVLPELEALREVAHQTDD